MTATPQVREPLPSSSREVRRRLAFGRPGQGDRRGAHFKLVAEATLTDTRPVREPPSRPLPRPPRALAYELVQGPLVRWTEVRDRTLPPPPTAFLLCDLRCHGDSTLLQKAGPHDVASAASDVLQLMGQLRITPRVLIGHSFGGKVFHCLRLWASLGFFSRCRCKAWAMDR
eukprot:SM001226S25890  [mRNA]  locus=s1226:20:2070:- [translate_table: standard]